MLTVNSILGTQDDPSLGAELHAHEHSGTLEHVHLSREDLARRRMRVESDQGTEVLIGLPRDCRLFDGAVLHLTDANAIVVRMEAERWMRVRPSGIEAALRLGYHAGNMHWRTRFDGSDLLIAVEREAKFYEERLAELTEQGFAQLMEDAGKHAGERA